MAHFSFSAKVYLREDAPAAGGRFPLYLKIIIGRVMKIYSLRKYVKKEQWSADAQRVKNQTPNARLINALVIAALEKSESIALRYELDGRTLSHADFKREYLQGANLTLRQLVEMQLKDPQHKFAPGSRAHKLAHVNKIEKFCPGVTLRQIDARFLTEYKNHMQRLEKPNSPNTVWETLKNLKACLNYAIKNGMLKESPFKNFRLEYQPPDRTFLEMGEIQTLRNAFAKMPAGNKKEVLRAYLGSCFCGLRHSDMVRLTTGHVKTEIIIHQQKTGDRVTVPVLDEFYQLLPKKTMPGVPLFTGLSNQKCNRWLGRISRELKINKPLTFHTARHTFGMLLARTGVDRGTGKALLGHKDQKSTDIYWHIAEDMKAKAMKKVSRLLKKSA